MAWRHRLRPVPWQTLRSILAFAVAHGRVQHNVAAAVRKPTSGRARREGQALTLEELRALMEACQGRYRDVVPMLALAGLRLGELAGLQVGDRVSVPGPGLRLRRTVLASGGGGSLYVDTLKSNRGRTVPLVVDLVPIVDRWSAGKAPDAWLFEAPRGGSLPFPLASGRSSARPDGDRHCGCCTRCCTGLFLLLDRSTFWGFTGIALHGRGDVAFCGWVSNRPTR